MRNDLWMCPNCGRQFANVNQSHACTDLGLAEHLAAKSEPSVAIYRAVETALRDCGEFRVHPQKTRVAFIARMTFAGVRLAQRWADLSFILPEPLTDHRIRVIEVYGPTSFGHTIRLHSPAEVDDVAREWLCAAWRRGRQETLDPRAVAEPLVGHALEVAVVPVREKVAEGPDGELVLEIPRYVADALAERPAVAVRIQGSDHVGTVEGRSGRKAWVRFDDPAALSSLGAVVGDDVDAFLRAV